LVLHVLLFFFVQNLGVFFVPTESEESKYVMKPDQAFTPLPSFM
jgi:hypothetical protein